MVEETGVPGEYNIQSYHAGHRSTQGKPDLPQITDKLYNIMLRLIRTHNVSDDRH